MPVYNTICDRSPCTRLLAVLGRLIHGAIGDDDESKLARANRPPSEQEDGEVSDGPGFAIYLDGFAPIYVTYCPFCGTRLDCVGIEILARYRYKKVPALKPVTPQNTTPEPVVIYTSSLYKDNIPQVFTKRPKHTLSKNFYLPVISPVKLCKFTS